jgi:hypothetical protein
MTTARDIAAKIADRIALSRLTGLASAPADRETEVGAWSLQALLTGVPEMLSLNHKVK